MRRFFALVLEHPYATLTFLGAATVFFAAQLPRAHLQTDLSKMFLDDPAVVEQYEETIREFGSDEIILVAFDTDGLFTAEGLQRMREAIDALERHPDIHRALAIVTADDIRGTEEELLVRPYFDDMEETAAWMADFQRRIADNPLYRDILISRNGETAAVLIELTVNEARAGEAMPALCAFIDETLAHHGVGLGGRHLLGFPVNVAETIVESQRNLTRIFPIAVVTVFVIGWMLFRALWPTLLTMGVAFLAVIWVSGFAVLLSRDVNILVTITPIVILVLSFADVVHLTNTYLTAITDGAPKEAAVEQTLREVGPACLYTSLTTLLGFGSFASVPVVIMRQFALIAAFGTAAALFIAVTLVPVVFLLAPAPRPRRVGLSAVHGSGLDRFLLGCEGLTRRRPLAIVGAAVLVAAVCAWTASQLRVEVDFVGRFNSQHPVRVAYDYVQGRLAGANTAEIIIETPERDGVYDPTFLRAVQTLQERVLALPEVDSALTLTDLLTVIHREMNAGETPPGALPESRALAAQYVLLYSFGGEEDLGRFVNFDRDRLRMAVRLNANGIQETHDATEHILAIASETLPPGVTASGTGLMVLFGNFLQYLIRSQVIGLVSAMATITGVMMIAFRSLRVGLGAMIVNFLPMLIFFGTIHWFDRHFDTDYIVVACVALGIAVDDTIHFLNRCRLELARVDGEVDRAIRRTFEHTGKPIVQTTLIILLGFSAFNLCGYTMARSFGAMLGCTLLWALLADLLLLPVLIRWGVVPLRPLPGTQVLPAAQAPVS